MMKFNVSKIIKDCLDNNGLAISLEGAYPPIQMLRQMYDEIKDFIRKNYKWSFTIHKNERRRSIYISHHSVYEIRLEPSYDYVRGFSMEKRKRIDEYLIDEGEQKNEENH
ncbi:MAG: hypothetical protein IJN40_05105 [Clostridia bacterium]|nr:hypothetical protein [Clostridia bacterium]